MKDLFNLPTVEVQLSELENLHFPSEDVLFTGVDKEERAKMLFLEWNGHGAREAEVTFEDLTGLKLTKGKLTGVADNAVYLNDKFKIPINRILKVKPVVSKH